MTDTTARETLYAALMTGGIYGRGHTPDRSEQASAMLDAFRDQVLTEAAAQQRAAAQRLDEYGLAAAQPLLVALADTIDPTTQGMFVPARVRDAAADLLAARTTTALEG